MSEHQPTKLKWKGVDYALSVYSKTFGWLVFPSDEDEPPEEWLAHVWRRGTTDDTKHVAEAVSKTRVQAVLDGIGELQKWEVDNPPEMQPPKAEPDAGPDAFAGAATFMAAVLMVALLGLITALRGCGL